MAKCGAETRDTTLSRLSQMSKSSGALLLRHRGLVRCGRTQEAPPASSLQARWDQVSALCREKAVQICGVLARRTGAPWLAEKETEVKQLDTWISEAQEADRQIRNNPHNLPPEEWTQQKRRKRHQLQAARQHKAQTLQQWEENWLTQQAHLADQASARHDMGTVFRIVKDLANS